MIITIQVTEAAIEYLAEAATLGDRETAEEILRICLGLCNKTGSPGPEDRLDLEHISDLASRIVIDTLDIDPGKIPVSRAVIRDHVRRRIVEELRNPYRKEDYISQAPESDETRLRKTAREVVKGYQKAIDNNSGALWVIAKPIKDLERALQEPEEREDLRLRKTALALLDYYDRFGPETFQRHFGVKGVSDEALLEICREIIQEGEGSSHE